MLTPVTNIVIPAALSFRPYIENINVNGDEHPHIVFLPDPYNANAFLVGSCRIEYDIIDDKWNGSVLCEDDPVHMGEDIFLYEEEVQNIIEQHNLKTITQDILRQLDGQL